MFAYLQMQAALLLFFVGFLTCSCGPTLNPSHPHVVVPRVAQTLPWWINLMETNADCGLVEKNVLKGVQIKGAVGMEGQAIWTQEGCRVHIPEPVLVAEECEGNIYFHGSFSISYEKAMTGWVSRDKIRPISLDRYSAIEYNAQIRDIKGHFINDQEEFVLKGKTLSFAASLGAKAYGEGLCDQAADRLDNIAMDASGLSFEMINVAESLAVSDFGFYFEGVESETNVMQTHLQGQWQVQEETLPFSIQAVLNRTEQQPGACAEIDEHSLPHKEPTCVSRREFWSQEAVRTSFPILDTVIELMERQPSCGFQSESVLAHSTWQGAVGSEAGTVTYDISQPCLIELREATPIEENCHGEKTLASGGIWVTGTKETRGWLTGHNKNSVVPNGAQATTYSLHLQFEDFEWAHPGWPTIGITHGALSAEVTPSYALDLESGKCQVRTPEMKVHALNWSDGIFVFEEDANRYQIQISSAQAKGQRGGMAIESNSFRGTAKVMGEEIAFPLKEKDGSVDRSILKFNDSFQCKPKVKYGPDAVSCDYLDVLSVQAASLILDSLKEASDHMNGGNESCGFQAPEVVSHPEITQDLAGTTATFSWEVASCASSWGDSSYWTDCSNNKTEVSGEFVYSGLKTEDGILKDAFDSAGLIPQNPAAMQLDVSELRFNNFGLSQMITVSDHFVEKRAVVIERGVLEGQYSPIRGANEEDSGVFDVMTPVARFANVSGEDFSVAVRLQGQTFMLEIDSFVLSGISGAFEGTANEIYGRMFVNGRWVQINTPFDTSYDQDVFDATYSCNEELHAVLPKD